MEETNPVIIDLSRFGYLEIENAIEILTAWKNDKMSQRAIEGLNHKVEIRIRRNDSDASAYMETDEYRVFEMTHKDRIEEIIICEECGTSLNESRFKEEMLQCQKCTGCQEILKDLVK